MLTALGLTILGAFFLGTFALPSKYVKNYAWENTWGAFFLLGMLVVPIGFSVLMLDGMMETYSQVEPKIIIAVIAGGFLWGCGFCCWGTGLSMVGLSLGYSLTMGTMALVGSVVPFFLGSADKLGTTGGKVVIAGILVGIVGVAINGYAGIQREKSQTGGSEGSGSGKKPVMLKGLLVCLLAGVLSSCLNIVFHIGGKIGNIGGISEGLGNAPWLAGLAIWTLIFLGGFISSCGFCAFLLFKNKSWGGFQNTGSARNIFLALIMAVGHFACLLAYGEGSRLLGDLGTSVGFSIFQSGSLLIGNGLGLFTGEWKGASAKSKNWLFTGLAVLILGIVVVSYGNYLIG